MKNLNWVDAQIKQAESEMKWYRQAEFEGNDGEANIQALHWAESNLSALLILKEFVGKLEGVKDFRNEHIIDAFFAVDKS